jgi:hypothetical protein
MQRKLGSTHYFHISVLAYLNWKVSAAEIIKKLKSFTNFMLKNQKIKGLHMTRIPHIMRNSKSSN